jgi:phosphoglycolate phosphatase-like HAD superfamily hydrolase
MPHIIWDWNGTLLDDTEAALKTLNIMIERRGGKPIGMEFYLDTFAFPVRPFYDMIGIGAKSEDEWNEIAREYHETYLSQPKGLNAGAVAALEAAKAAGCGQSMLSALRQDYLDVQMKEYGIDKYFDFVYGSNNLHGASKVDRARELIARLTAACSLTIPRFILIGDAVHDKEVADALGVPCVLVAQGSHAAWRLRAVAPTADTLEEAVELALQVTVA